MGVNRGPSMAYAILLALGWDAVEALNAIRATRPIAGVIYAGNALSWWHRTNGSSQLTFERDEARVAQWKRAVYTVLFLIYPPYTGTGTT